jgi:hypothetical protein
MEIGKPRRVHRVEPLRNPVPEPRREQEPGPERREPAKQPTAPAR